MDKACNKQTDTGLTEREEEKLEVRLSSQYCWYAKAMLVLLVLSGLFFAVPWYVIHKYNELQRKQAAVDAQWHHMINQYAQKANFSKHLANALTFYTFHEKKTLRQFADAAERMTHGTRAAVFNQNQQALDELENADEQLLYSLSDLLTTAQAHPDLTSNAVYRHITAQLDAADVRLVSARQRYAAAIADYDAASRPFPAKLIAMQVGKKSWPEFRLTHPSLHSVLSAAAAAQ